MSHIKKEFEEAVKRCEASLLGSREPIKDTALWAALWMAERLADLAKKQEFGDQYKDCPAAWLNTAYKGFENEIHRLAKELQA